MRSAVSIRAIMALAVVAATGSVGTAFSVERVRVKTIVEVEELDLVNDVVSGEVRSKRKACERRRSVVLFRRPPGGERIGSDRTDRRGDWEIADDDGFPEGEYRVKAGLKVVERPGLRIVCRRDSDSFG